jgi:nicotinamidase-related amidase
MAGIDHHEAASYRSAGFANRIGWGTSPVLLLIDVCTAYWTPGSPLDTSSNPASAASPESMRRLLAAAREGGCPVIWTKIEYADMSEAGMFFVKSKAVDVWRVGDARGYDQYVEGLEPRAGEAVITKKYASAFFGTDLATRLNVLRADTVVVCGVSTSGCVRASALDAMQYGFRPMVCVTPRTEWWEITKLIFSPKVVGSACGDRSLAIHNANLFDMNAKMADAVSEEEAVGRLKAGVAIK